MQNMATSHEHLDWQSTKKTLLERSRHMFNNPFMSDVALKCEDSDKKFFAHKYVLSTSSVVFYAMFYGELAETNAVVPLSDANDESLEEFLRFLYTDECNLTADNAAFVLYLAKKYIVSSLADKCIEFLIGNLVTENVFIVLQQALQFDEKELESKCWELIDLNTSDAIVAECFTDINQATLTELLKRESLKVKEVDLFKAVVKWSEAECSKKGIDANAKNKRIVMGNAIYHIRFSSMNLQQFAQDVCQSAMLTAEEKVLFYDRFCGVERQSEVWNMSERTKNEGTLLRCCRFVDHCVVSPAPDFWNRVPCSQHSVCISFSKPVKILGVRLLGGVQKEYDVTLEVFSHVVEKTYLSQMNSRGLFGFDVLLPLPIKVQANVVVHIKATITGARSPLIGSGGRRKVTMNDITVNFLDIPGVPCGETCVQNGQFDEIIFTEI